MTRSTRLSGRQHMERDPVFHMNAPDRKLMHRPGPS